MASRRKPGAEAAARHRAEVEAEIRDALRRLPDYAEDEDAPYAARTVRDYLAELEDALASEDAEELDELRQRVRATLHRAETPPTGTLAQTVRGVLEGLSVAVGSNALSGSVTFSGALTAELRQATELRRDTDAIRVDELRRGAVEYNVGRSGVTSLPVPFSSAEPVLAIPSRPLSPNALRVCAILMGAWVATSSDGCAPDVGQHVAGCRHATNRVGYTLRALTRAAMGEDGGRQRELVGAALLELGHDTTEFYLWDAATGRYGHQVSHILSFREVGTLPAYAVPRDMPPDATGYLAWDPFLHESLMRGHYAVLPAELVRELSGADFAVWLAVLLQPATRELARAGERREYSVSGTAPLLDRARLGLGRQRPDKLRASLERAAERGNAISESRLGLRLSVAERTRRGRSVGYKLVLERVRDRASLRLSEGMYTGTGDVYSGTGGMYTGTGDVYSRTSNVRETASLDALSSLAQETGSRGRAHGARETLSRKRGHPSEYPAPSWDEDGSVMASWRERYPRPPTTAQLRRLAELVANNDAPGIARALREAPPGEDAFGAVMSRDSRDNRDARARQLEAERRSREAARRHAGGVASVGAVLEAVVPVSAPPGEAVRQPEAAPEPEDEAERAARRRAMAVAMLRAGLTGDKADRLRADHGITDEELRG